MVESIFNKLVQEYHWESSDPKKDYDDFVSFQKLNPKIIFTPFTVDICRANIGKEIPTYFQNGGLNPNNMLFGPTMIDKVNDRNNPKKVFTTIFVPNGDIMMGTGRNQKVIKGWLNDPNNTTKNFTRHAAENFFLLGKIKFLPNSTMFQDWKVGLINALTGHLATNGSGDSWVQA
ncbi:MAG: hypothetical protein WD512_20755 [Candidatus Paceibacterota bacterium]